MHVPRAASTDGEVPRCQNSSPVAEVQQCVDKASERHSQVSVTATGGARPGEEMLVDGPLLEVPPAQRTPGSVLRGAASQCLAERGGEGSPQRGHSMVGGGWSSGGLGLREGALRPSKGSKPLQELPSWVTATSARLLSWGTEAEGSSRLRVNCPGPPAKAS